MHSSNLGKPMRSIYRDNVSFKNIENVLMNLRKIKKEFVEPKFSTLQEKKKNNGFFSIKI